MSAVSSATSSGAYFTAQTFHAAQSLPFLEAADLDFANGFDCCVQQGIEFSIDGIQDFTPRRQALQNITVSAEGARQSTNNVADNFPKRRCVRAKVRCPEEDDGPAGITKVLQQWLILHPQ